MHLSPQRRLTTPSPGFSPSQRSRSSTTPTSPSLARSKVLSGRVKKASPKEKRKAQQDDLLEEAEDPPESELLAEMQAEKDLFPGSKGWADDEEQLFEILFMRQYRPLLPAHWDIDFRGIPMPDVLFSKSDAERPIIRAHSEHEFKATRALINLIDLSTSVRCLSQAGQRDKMPPLIKRELEAYYKWAAQDGGYDQLDVIPNLVIEIIDTTMSSERIEEYMKMRLITLAMTHRQFWRTGESSSEIQAAVPFSLESTQESCINSELTDVVKNGIDNGEDSRQRELENQVVLIPTSIHSTPATKKTVSFGAQESRVAYSIRRPPVLYGLFIVHGSVMVLTLDAAKDGDDAYVSYQVEVGFNKKNQGVWNAITIAIVVCLARDEMINRKDEFKACRPETDSDPDA